MVPQHALFQLVRIPREEWYEHGITEELLAHYSLSVVELFWGWPGDERQEELAHSAGKFYCKLRGLVCAQEGKPHTLFGALLGQGMSLRQTVSVAFFLSISGHFTTTLLMNTALHAALDREGNLVPGTFALDQLTNSERLTEHVRGVLAHQGPVPTWRRQAKANTTLGERSIAAGEEILIHLSGRQDAPSNKLNALGKVPQAFQPHALAFGWGNHRCLGAILAESEVCWVLDEIARWAVENNYRLSIADSEWVNVLPCRAPLNAVVTIAER